MYARGILFGKMKYELGDHIVIRCPENNLSADIEFKVKGYFTGGYNAIGGVIKNDKTGETLFELSGSWDAEMEIKNVINGHKEVLFNARGAKHSPPLVRPLEEQTENESQKLWLKTCIAIRNSDHNAATEEKTKIEEAQRARATQRQEQGHEWHPTYFRAVNGGPGNPEEGEENLDWILAANMLVKYSEMVLDTNVDSDGATPEEKSKQILAIMPILPGDKNRDSEPVPQTIPQPRRAANTADLAHETHPGTQTSSNQPVEQVVPPRDFVTSKKIERKDTDTNSVDEFVDAET